MERGAIETILGLPICCAYGTGGQGVDGAGLISSMFTGVLEKV